MTLLNVLSLPHPVAEELVEYDLTHENAPPCEEEFLGDNDSATSNFDDSHYAREDEAVQSTLSDAPHVGAAANGENDAGIASLATSGTV